MAYPVDLTPDTDGQVMASFPDLPEALTSGAGRDDAMVEAADCLEAAIAARVMEKLDIPKPSPAAGRPVVSVPFQTAAKATLYAIMRASGTTNSELARRLERDLAEIRRMLDPRFNTRMDKLQDAIEACGAEAQITMRAPTRAAGLRAPKSKRRVVVVAD